MEPRAVPMWSAERNTSTLSTFRSTTPQVTALEECRLLVWHRDRLKFHLMDDAFLQVTTLYYTAVPLGIEYNPLLILLKSNKPCPLL